MKLPKNVLLGSALIVLAMITFSVIVYAGDDTHYYSYTKAIKYCGPEGCMMQDFVVYCFGNKVIDIEPIARRFYVPRDFEWDDQLGWCESKG